MKKLIFQLQGRHHRDELDRLEERINKDLSRQGFIVIDESIKVIEFNNGDEIDLEITCPVQISEMDIQNVKDSIKEVNVNGRQRL